VLLTRKGAKLLDFNIASRVGDPVKTLSGTPPYQAPDADYTRWDVSTDLFAVGVMLYELLCNGSTRMRAAGRWSATTFETPVCFALIFPSHSRSSSCGRVLPIETTASLQHSR